MDMPTLFEWSGNEGVEDVGLKNKRSNDLKVRSTAKKLKAEASVGRNTCECNCKTDHGDFHDWARGMLTAILVVLVLNFMSVNFLVSER